MHKLWTSIAALTASIFIVSGAAFAQEEIEKESREKAYDRVSIRVNFWTASYNGEIDVADKDVFGGTLKIKGDTLDLDKELGIENPQTIPEIDFWVRLGKRHRIIASYFWVEYSGDEILDQDVDLAGYTFTLSTALDTSFTFSRFELMYQYNPVLNEKGRLGLMLGWHNYLWTMEYEGIETHVGSLVDDSLTLVFPIPVAGIEGEVSLGYGFGIHGTFSGMGIGIGDLRASYTDLDLGLSYHYKRFQANLGYRTINTLLAGEDDDADDLEMTFSHQGWLLSVGLLI